MPRRRIPQQTRAVMMVEAILDSGFQVVAKRGRGATTTRHIADAAGISVGSLYEYFADKQAIFTAMDERITRDIVAMVRRITPRLVRMSVREALVDLLQEFRSLMLSDEERYLKYLRLAGLDDMRRQLEPVQTALLEMVPQFLMHQPEAVRLRHIPTMAYIFINGGMYALIRHLTDPHPPMRYEELTEGLALMVSHYVSRELQLARSARN